MRIPVLIAGCGLLVACGGGGSGGGTAGNVPPPPLVGTTPIWEIQGGGDASPLAGQTVRISGIVTGDFQDNDGDVSRNLGGFYVQGIPDADLESSEGIFVFDGDNPAVDVDAGDSVQVEGRVDEYFGETQINATSVEVRGFGSVKPFPMGLLPFARTVTNDDGEVIADLERLEGMLVTFSDPLTVTELRNLERYGAVTLSEGGRLFQFTNTDAPDVDGYAAHKEAIALRSIELDDGLRSQNPADPRFLNAGTAPGYSIRLGDTVEGLTGNLRFSRGSGSNGKQTWRLVPTVDPVFESVNPRPGVPDVGGTLRVGAFNVLNFFTTIDAGQDDCGPSGTSGCRGADSSAELSRQLDKTVTALLTSGVDIVGLTELENNADASLSALVDAMNTRVGSADFAYVDTGIIHDDVIKAGLIYRSTAVTPVGDAALLDRNVDSRFNDDRNRPSLAQTFDIKATGARLTVVVNHLKSKGSSCDSDGDPNLDDGQGNCNLTRTSAATALADWIATDPTGSGDDDFLVIGDMNAYYLEDPIEAFRGAGLVDLLNGRPNPYSFTFDGQSGAYDYAFASASLAPQVTGTIEWHINVDEPPLLDYNLEFGRDPALFDASTPYRASDHDPVIIGLDLAN